LIFFVITFFFLFRDQRAGGLTIREWGDGAK